MKARVIAVSLLVICGLTAVGSGAFWASRPGPEMTTAANRWLEQLTDAQREKAVLAYDAPQRVDWHFIPKDARKGLQIKDMTPPQRKAALELLNASLSQIGYGKATKIMALEALLKELEKTRKGTPLRDTERYYFTVFGQPNETSRWGLSIEGHHMSLNFVVEKGNVISSTPTMFGSNPALVKGEDLAGIAKGTRVLAKEELLAFELVESLNAEQMKKALIAEKALDEVRNAGKPQPPLDGAVGLAASAMTEAQQKTLKGLVEAYAENLPEEVAKQRLDAIRASGFEKLHFAWAGATKPGIGHYYRVQGETFLIEFVNTQPDAAGNVANHIHCVWRDMAGDFALPAK